MSDLLRTFVRNRKAAIGLAIVLAYVAIALAAPLLAPFDPIARVGRPRGEGIAHAEGWKRATREIAGP